VSAFWIYLALSTAVASITPWVGLPLGLGLALRLSLRQRCMLMAVLGLFVLRQEFRICPELSQGRVIELNRSSVVVSHWGFQSLVRVGNIEAYALGDWLSELKSTPAPIPPTRYGFNAAQWARARNLCGIASADHAHQRGQGFWPWVSRGGFSRSSTHIIRIRAVLFQSHVDAHHTLWISLGLIFVVWSEFLHRLTLKLSSDSMAWGLWGLGMFWIGYTLGFPLAWWRVVVFEVTLASLSDRQKRLALRTLILLWIAPEGLSQLAIVLPLMLNLISVFRLSEWRQLDRYLGLQALFHLHFFESHPLMMWMYSSVRKLHKRLIQLAFLSVFFPFLAGGLDWAYASVSWLERLVQRWSLRGRFSVWVMLGYLLWIMVKGKLSQRVHVSLGFALAVFGIWLGNLPWVHQVSMINVHQGDAFLLQSPRRQAVVLIDTGPAYAANNLVTYLKAQGISRITHLVLTHDDHDHVGALSALQSAFHIDTLIVESQDIISPRLNLKVLNTTSGLSANDQSLVYWTSIHGCSMIFLGDVSMAQERELAHRYPQLTSHIVKVAHHGSNTSTSHELLSWSSARLAWIGVGRNRYQHPHPDVMERLAQHHVRPYQTLLDGDVELFILPHISIQRTSHNKFLVFACGPK
jgi:competence protein ComEC